MVPELTQQSVLTTRVYTNESHKVHIKSTARPSHLPILNGVVDASGALR